MKTVDEFIQRLQNDPEFEHKAQSYENSDDFLEFVKGEGYDFTLDQLLTKFRYEHRATNTPEEESSTSGKTVEDFIQRLHDDPVFEQKARAFEDLEDFLGFAKAEGYDFTVDQLMYGFKQGKESPDPPEDVKPASPKEAMVIPILRKPESAEIKQEDEPSLNRAEKGQEPAQTLYPKFEGTSGRRRGMKWRHVDGEEV
jgi:predicted ribosomally synthesized peptide with nif11-like leader